jgi:arylsulfatase A-like enzyme
VIDGQDISPILFGSPGAKSRYDEVGFFYYMMGQLQAVRSGPWKLYLPLKSKQIDLRKKAENQPAMLFDVRNDVGQTRNVAAAHPDVVVRLTALAEKAREDIGDMGRDGKRQRPAGHVDDPKPQVLP